MLYPLGADLEINILTVTTGYIHSFCAGFQENIAVHSHSLLFLKVLGGMYYMRMMQEKTISQLLAV